MGRGRAASVALLAMHCGAGDLGGDGPDGALVDPSAPSGGAGTNSSSARAGAAGIEMPTDPGQVVATKDGSSARSNDDAASDRRADGSLPVRVGDAGGYDGPIGAANVWTDVTPTNVDLSSLGGCGNYGAESVQRDPARPSDLYTLFMCHGIWKSTDYGQTWNGTGETLAIARVRSRFLPTTSRLRRPCSCRAFEERGSASGAPSTAAWTGSDTR